VTRREEVRAQLARHGLAAHRDRGQNFLVDPDAAEAIAAAARLAPGDAVIEIGPGLGALTRALAARARRVAAIEIDAGLVRALRDEAALPPHVELIHADALEVDLAALARRLGEPVRLVANLPYSVASPLLRRLLELREILTSWLVLVQREVAARLVATPGSRAYGSFAVLHALCGRVERVRDLPPRCFHPVPRVTSTLVRVTPLEAGRIESGPAGDELLRVERVVRAAFGKRRKTLANALRGALAPGPAEGIDAALARLGIDRHARAEVVDPETFLALTRALHGGG
jgi:16S rRNA (adenine1518-N6/adenine1519-N6)-dimethyltransferase